MLESEAAQDALQRTLSSPAVERAAVEVLDSDLVDHVWDQLLRSDEAQKLIERIAEAPELRAAIASQGVGLLRDIGRQIRAVAGRLDNGLERFVRRVIGRPRTQPTDHIGLIARVSAAVLDGVILNGIFLAAAALFGFVFSALGDPEGVGAAGIVFGLGSWIVFGSVYLLTFWAAAGQTPGMRLLSIRIHDEDGSRLGSPRAAAVGRPGAGDDPARPRSARLGHPRRSPRLLGPPREHRRGARRRSPQPFLSERESSV